MYAYLQGPSWQAGLPRPLPLRGRPCPRFVWRGGARGGGGATARPPWGAVGATVRTGAGTAVGTSADVAVGNSTAGDRTWLAGQCESLTVLHLMGGREGGRERERERERERGREGGREGTLNDLVVHSNSGSRVCSDPEYVSDLAHSIHATHSDGWLCMSLLLAEQAKEAAVDLQLDPRPKVHGVWIFLLAIRINDGLIHVRVASLKPRSHSPGYQAKVWV